MKEIQLTKGYVAQVSDEDYEWLSQYHWCSHERDGGYVSAVKSKSRKEPIFRSMHRMILGVTDPNIFVDHKDRNPLNNQRCNLRKCNASESSRNVSSTKNSTSKYLGVSWAKNNNKWQVHIALNYKRMYLGLYTDEREAALAYNRKAAEIFGEFANLNQV